MNGIKPQAEKVKAISEMKLPNRFVDATRPMTKLTRKGVKFKWTEECQTEFECLKACLTEAPILKYSNPSK